MLTLVRRTCFALVALASLCNAPANAGPLALTTVGDLPAQTRPAGVPEDYIVTPSGYFHAACVVSLAEGETVARNGDVQRVDGRLRKVAACAHDSFARNGMRRAPGTEARPDASASPDAAYDGWVAYSNSNYGVTPPAKTMSADFVVPSAPSSASGQVLYYFPGLETAPNSNSILQPVLGWNGYGSPVWTMANWNCCISGTTYHGPSISVSTGDRITGTMTGSKCSSSGSGICTNWAITSKDTTNGRTTTFNTKAYGQAFNWYFGGVMEVYGVSTCTQYPSNGSMDFTNVHVADLNGNTVSPTWLTAITSTAPACSYVVTAPTTETRITFRAH